MEKKTIGQFIAALRKASGLTQKELAEKLNVSDKAVSRWERDECAPDLSLIPVIADLFGVTADELLRGERRPKTADTASGGDVDGQPFSAKSQKQLQYMIKKSLMQYRIQCLIVSGIAVTGIIVTMILNALCEALIGFFVGLVLMVIAAIYLIAVTILTSFQGHDEALEEKTAKNYQKSVICTAYWVFSAILMGFSVFLLPLPNNVDVPHIGCDWSTLCNDMAGYALITAFLCLVGRAILQAVLIKHHLAAPSPSLRRNRALIIKTAGILAGVIAVIVLANAVFAVYAASELPFVKGTTFENYADFKAYMELPRNHWDGSYYSTQVTTASDTDYYIQEIRNDKGELLVSYSDKNETVTRIEFSDTENYLPLTVYTDRDAEANRHIIELVQSVSFVVIVGAIIGAILFYIKKRQK